MIVYGKHSDRLYATHDFSPFLALTSYPNPRKDLSPGMNRHGGGCAILSPCRPPGDNIPLVTCAIPLKRVGSATPFSRLSVAEQLVSLVAMQRLFSMFPTGAAGIALVLLRFSAAATLLMIVFPRGEVITSEWAFAGLAVLAAFFLLGAFTPALCTLCCCIEVAAIFGLRGIDAVHMLLSIVETAALAMLGPGGYSLDARMFGRRRVVLSTDERSDMN
jgi:hypothetical protein